MLIMIVCYTLMGRELWGSRSIGEHTERQFESMKSKKKVRQNKKKKRSLIALDSLYTTFFDLLFN